MKEIIVSMFNVLQIRYKKLLVTLLLNTEPRAPIRMALRGIPMMAYAMQAILPSGVVVD